jgi:hypothetical protein
MANGPLAYQAQQPVPLTGCAGSLWAQRHQGSLIETDHRPAAFTMTRTRHWRRPRKPSARLITCCGEICGMVLQKGKLGGRLVEAASPEEK